jgi:hypothetical protein
VYSLPLLRLEEADDCLELTAGDLIGLVGLTLVKGFTNAEDDGKAGVESGTGFLGDDLIGLMEESATFRVTSEHERNAGVVELSGPKRREKKYTEMRLASS